MLKHLADFLEGQSKYTRFYLWCSEINPDPVRLSWDPNIDEFGWFNDQRPVPSNWTEAQIRYLCYVLFRHIHGMKTYVSWDTLQKFVLCWGDHENFDVSWERYDDMFELIVYKVNVQATIDDVADLLNRVTCSIHLNPESECLKPFSSFQRRMPSDLKCVYDGELFVYSKGYPEFVSWTADDVARLKRMFAERPWVHCCFFRATVEEYDRFVAMYQPEFSTSVEYHDEGVVQVYR